MAQDAVQLRKMFIRYMYALGNFAGQRILISATQPLLNMLRMQTADSFRIIYTDLVMAALARDGQTETGKEISFDRSRVSCGTSSIGRGRNQKLCYNPRQSSRRCPISVDLVLYLAPPGCTEANTLYYVSTSGFLERWFSPTISWATNGCCSHDTRSLSRTTRSVTALFADGLLVGYLLRIYPALIFILGRVEQLLAQPSYS